MQQAMTTLLKLQGAIAKNDLAIKDLGDQLLTGCDDDLSGKRFALNLMTKLTDLGNKFAELVPESKDDIPVVALFKTHVQPFDAAFKQLVHKTTQDKKAKSVFKLWHKASHFSQRHLVQVRVCLVTLACAHTVLVMSLVMLACAHTVVNPR